MRAAIHIAVFGVVVGLQLALSYGLAHVGQPNAVWFWRDMLGVAV